MVNATSKFIFEPMLDKDGTAVDRLYILTLSKKLSDLNGGPENFQNMLASVGGIDAFEPIGMYTMRLRIARTFDGQEVINEIGASLEGLLSDLALPSSATNSKVIKFPGSIR